MSRFNGYCCQFSPPRSYGAVIGHDAFWRGKRRWKIVCFYETAEYTKQGWNVQYAYCKPAMYTLITVCHFAMVALTWPSWLSRRSSCRRSDTALVPFVGGNTEFFHLGTGVCTWRPEVVGDVFDWFVGQMTDMRREYLKTSRVRFGRHSTCLVLPSCRLPRSPVGPAHVCQGPIASCARHVARCTVVLA